MTTERVNGADMADPAPRRSLFRALPEGRTRVRQFDLDNTRCDTIGRILINGVAACDGEGLAGTECIDRLALATRTKAEIAG